MRPYSLFHSQLFGIIKASPDYLLPSITDLSLYVHTPSQFNSIFPEFNNLLHLSAFPTLPFPGQKRKPSSLSPTCLHILPQLLPLFLKHLWYHFSLYNSEVADLVLSQLPSYANAEFLKKNKGILVVRHPDFVKDFTFPKVDGELREKWSC
jgi:hypothetical protein